MAYLALAHEFSHRSNRIFDRRVGIDAMLVIEVDDINPQPFQAFVAALAHIVRLSVDPQKLAVGSPHVAEFGSDNNIVALALDGLAEELLIGSHPIHIGRIEKIDTKLQGPVDGGDGFRIISARIELGHSHAAQTHC
jgi:hypothetical protein